MQKFMTALGLVAGLLAAPLSASEVNPRPIARPPNALLVEVKVASNAGFLNWVKAFRIRAQARGITKTTLDKALRGISYNAGVVAKDRHQPEFKKQFWDYLDSAASPLRVQNGMKALRKHNKLLTRIEARYGVEKEVVAAIWGLESAYGTFRGKTRVIEALATLAYDGRRGRFFEAQLIAALKIIQSGDVRPRNMKGSWAGAMGHTQFIPTSYLSFAQDFDGDGRRDIWADDPTDALASTAAYLANFGWRKGQPWGVQVVLPKKFNYRLASRSIRKSPGEWAAMGVLTVSGGVVPNHGRASILLPAGSTGAAFMIFSNFAVIERYNKADAYVVGVGHLADRIAGGPPIKAQWPRNFKALSIANKKEMQRHLTREGFDTHGIDGIIGPNTLNAIRAFQASVGVAQDGYPSQGLLKLLRNRRSR